MEAFLQNFVTLLAHTETDILSAALLCFFAVREHLRGSLVRHMLAAAASALVFTLIFLPLWVAFGISRNLCLIPYLAAAFFYYRRVANVEPLKLLFIMLLALNYQFFLNPANNIPLALMGIRGGGMPYVWPDVIFNFIAIAATLPLVMWFVRKKLWPLMQSPGGDWKLLWTLPTMFIMLHYLFYDALTQMLYELPQYSLLMMFLGICAYLVYYIILRVLKAADENARNLERVEQMERQLAMQGERFVEIAEHIDEVKALRHDMRHHMGVIDGMLARCEYDKATEYLSEYTAEQVGANEPTLCQNLVVDVIARHYMTQAKRLGIKTDFRLSLPAKTGIADTDLCIVLGNMIENALKACASQKSGERFLSVQSEIQENRVLVDVINSFDASLQDTGRKGMGISSVQAIAKKYGGIAMFKKNGNVFEASALLYRERE